MTVGAYLSCLGTELIQKTDTYVKLEQTLLKDVTITNLKQIYDFIYKKIELEEIKERYNTLKALIHENSIDLKTKIPDTFIANCPSFFDQ